VTRKQRDCALMHLARARNELLTAVDFMGSPRGKECEECGNIHYNDQARAEFRFRGGFEENAKKIERHIASIHNWEVFDEEGS